MKHLSLLIWLTQLGLSVVGPLVGYILLAVWLRDYFDLGSWIVICGVALGVFSAVDGLLHSMKLMSRMEKNHREDETPPPVSFNDHD